MHNFSSSKRLNNVKIISFISLLYSYLSLVTRTPLSSEFYLIQMLIDYSLQTIVI